jgi:hypothetical protein
MTWKTCSTLLACTWEQFCCMWIKNQVLWKAWENTD